MKYYKIVPFKFCNKCFTFKNNFKTVENGWYEYVDFNSSIIEQETSEKFEVNTIISEIYGPRRFLNIGLQLDPFGQQLCILIEKGSAEIFIINADPESDDFGSSQKAIIWGNNGIYIARYHAFGICSTKKGTKFKLIYGSPIYHDHNFKFKFEELQSNNEKFDGYEKSNVSDIRDNRTEIVFDRKIIMECIKNFGK